MGFPVVCANRDCGIRFASGLLRCPRCRDLSPQYAKPLEEEAVPRITVAAGPTNAAALPGEVGYIPPEDPAAPEDPATPAFEAPSLPAATDDAGPLDASPAHAPAPSPASDYAGLTVPQLRAAAKERELPTGGTKTDLIERLTAAAQVTEGGD